MKTLAAVLYGLNTPLVLAELEIPPLQKGHVLVQVLSSGICRSQLNEIKGYKGEDKYLPHLLGHEGAGIVMETGKGVKKVSIGDKVILTWIKGKGLEGLPAKYKLGNKIINSGPVVTFVQKAVVSENRLVKYTADISPDTASLLGCAVPTGAGMVIHRLKPEKNSSIIIFGIGGVGSAAILASKMAGCRKIIAVDIHPQALQFAGRLGATEMVIYQKDKMRERISQIIPQGADYAIEASGNKKAMESAISIVKETGTVVIAGNLRRGEKICLDPFELIRGKKIIGTRGGETNPDIDIPFYIRKYMEKKLDLDSLITGRFKFDEINKAISILERGKKQGRLIVDLS